MARDTFIRFNINVKSSSQMGRGSSSRPQADIEEVEKAAFQAINYCIADIAFKAAKSQQRTVQNQLEARMGGIVMGELRRMGQKISTHGIGLGQGARYPTGGSLQIEGGLSQSLARANPDLGTPMSIQAVTGMWRERTSEYLKRKSKKYGHRKWWLNEGDLRNQLKNPQLYLGAYGPIRIRWIPERIENDYARGGVSRYSGDTRNRNLRRRPEQRTGVAPFARGVGNSYTLSVGRIEMSILGRITPQMLNAPGEPAYNSKSTGLFSSMPESVEKKLEGRWAPRVLVEPFLTYYLNRQIPNRIFRELENSMKAVGVTR